MWILLIIFLLCLSIVTSYKIKYKYGIISTLRSIRGEKSSLFMSLGTKIGVGSIVGTASSIILGGYSSVIWMIIFSFITSSLIYYEAYLGKKYSVNNVSGMYFIIRNGLNKRVLSIFSLIMLILLYSFLFQMIQSNTIGNILYLNYGIDKRIICISLIIVISFIIFFNIKDVINVMNKIVPVMCILFIILSLYGVISNLDIFVNNLKHIDLFNIKSLMCGMVIGIKRSIFMNETLIGTTSVSSGIDNNDIITSSNIQVLCSYFISFFITIIIASLLIIYNPVKINDYNLLISETYFMTTGKIGIYILSIIVILFGVTTMLSGYYIGKSNIDLIVNSKVLSLIFKVLFVLSVVIGVYVDNNLIWKYLDKVMFIMILINSYSIIRMLGSGINDRK